MYKQVGKKEVTVKAALDGDGIQKTFPFSIRVLEASGSLWKQDTMTIVVQEDTTISYSLVSFLRNPSATNVVFSSSNTGVSGTSWSYTIPWGAASTDTISLIASAGDSEKSELKVFLVVSSKDSEEPEIALVNPSTQDATVSDSVVVCKFTITDKLSGVGTIIVKKGTEVLTDTLRSGSTFECKVSGLIKGELTTLVLEAYDKSMLKNSSTMQVQLTYDPLMQDNVQPELRYKNPVGDSAIVTTSQTSIEVVAVDRKSGIDSVWAFRGTTRLPVVQTDSIYSVTLDNLVAGKTDTVIFKAQDKSELKNTNTLTVFITCEPTASDKIGPVIKLSNPAQDRSKVAQSSATLVVICKDESGISAVNYTFGSLNGAMTKADDSSYSVVLPNLVKGDNQITILATDASLKKNVSDTVFTIVYDPTMDDTTAPEITLKTPEKDNATVSSKSISIEVMCTDASGIDTVTCKMGTTDIPVLKGVGGVYSTSVTTLDVGENTFTFTATDKASTKQSASKTLTVVYDPSMTDNVAPKVVIKNPLNADQRVSTDTLTVQIECTDDSKISSVTATRGGAPVTGITNVNSLYSVKVTKLTAGMSDTINFKVVDNSSNKNAKDFPVILRYNRQPVAATLGTPADGATGIAKSPTFTWTDGTDPDGDAVTYTLRYGTSETALSKTVPNLTAKTATLTTALSVATKYFWQVVTYTTVDGDSAVSDIASFTTVEDKPVITVEPTTQSVVLGNKCTFSVTATGLNLKYQWYKGTTAISGATLPTYTTSAVIASDDGSTYYCAVSNGGGEVKSSVVSLVVEYSVTYDVNGGSETAPVDNNTYAKGESATVKAGTGLTRKNYTFGGWVRHGVTNSKVYKAGDTLMISSGSVTLDAVWNAVTYTLTYDGNGSSGSVPSSVTGIESGTSVIVSGAGSLARENCEFLGWNTDASATSAKYTASSAIIINADTKLYAIWKELPTYKVTYNANGGGYSGSGGHGSGSVPTDSKAYLNDAVITVPGNTGDLSRVGYVFGGWSKTETGKAITQFQINGANVTLYAQWLIKDASGNEYKEIKIGNQVWMAEDLKTTKLNNGNELSYATENEASYVSMQSLTTGVLYNGFAVMEDTNKLLAPDGWRVATFEDWETLIKTVNENAKSLASKEYWQGSDVAGSVGSDLNANNGSGFNAYPLGFFSVSGGYGDALSTAYYWRAGSGSFYDYRGKKMGSDYRIEHNNAVVNLYSDVDCNYFESVRCVREY